jgi:hypothetical protein
MPITVVLTGAARWQPTKTVVTVYQKSWAPLFLMFLGQYALSQHFLMFLDKKSIDLVP